ncbi:MAG: hypothetical protein NTU77_12580, partial [Actinobacteria bacterium]|nr:hypothetical protein [Actinomycetota bacterium]
FPALWKLRRSHPDHPRPYRAPMAPLLSIVLTAWVVFATIQLLLPGFAIDWFGDDFRLDGWGADEKWTYLLVEAIPLSLFILLGVIFYFSGSKARHHKAADALPETVPAQHS